MKKVVFKYPVPLTALGLTLNFPGSTSKVVEVASQGSIFHIWVEHVAPDTTQSSHSRTFAWVGTGHIINSEWEYIGTIHSGAFVWHLYEVK